MRELIHETFPKHSAYFKVIRIVIVIIVVYLLYLIRLGLG